MRFLSLLVLLSAGSVFAQPKGGPPPPPLLGCGNRQSGVEILCGARSPEDLELTPDGKFLIVSQFVNGAGGNGVAGLALFDLAKKTYSKMAVTSEPRKDWGDAACMAQAADALRPHGTSLTKRSGGAMQLYIVNHGGRESIEMFEVKQDAGAWTAVWHGCVTSMQGYNDVAALADGGFVATHPTALQQQGTDVFAGAPSGYTSRWAAGKGETELPGTRYGYPNGVVASTDGRFAYINAWTAKEVHKYDLRNNKETAMVKLDFMPDNLTWTKKGELLAAGVKSARGDCPAGSGTPCVQAFEVARIAPAKMEAKTVFDGQGKGSLISGVSVALEADGWIYVGSFSGDRLVRFEWKP